MTLKDTVIQHLTDNGMWLCDASAIIEDMIVDSSNESMLTRWNDDVEGYSSITIRMMIMQARERALVWIDTNKPMAWFRPMFA